jgi:hypothetical protein
MEGLVGDPRVIKAVDAGLPLTSIVDLYSVELAAFANRREKYLLYSDRACVPASR